MKPRARKSVLRRKRPERPATRPGAGPGEGPGTAGESSIVFVGDDESQPEQAQEAGAPPAPEQVRFDDAAISIARTEDVVDIDACVGDEAGLADPCSTCPVRSGRDTPGLEPATTVMTASDLRAMKGRRSIVAIVAHDLPTAAIAEEAGADMVLVDDSLGPLVYGLEDRLSLQFDELVRHCRAVSRGVDRALVVADLPLFTHVPSMPQAVLGAGRLVAEGRAGAVKLRGGSVEAATVKRLVEMGIPVLGHVGPPPLAPRSGRPDRPFGADDAERNRALDDALAMQEAGVFAIVLGSLDARLAAHLTRQLSVPAIGLGCGTPCDGEILVAADLLGLSRPASHGGSDDPRAVLVSTLGRHVVRVRGR